jgi:hypothetical protein
MVLNAWLFGLFILAATALVLLFLHQPRIGALFHEHVRDRPRRRLFLAAIGFFFTVGLARLAAFAASRNFGPFHYIVIRGTHIHHLVWGIFLLLAVGFCWLIEVGTGDRYSSLFTSRLLSLLYGIGAALTLDEFTFWFDLSPNAYWNRNGRASIELVLLFGFALLLGIWGRSFWRALSREVLLPRRKSR